MKKYIEFTGTISGTTYFLRNLLCALLGFFVGYGIGYGIGMSNIGLIMFFVVLFAPVMWFQVATIYKRMVALFPSEAAFYTGALVLAQLTTNFLEQGSPARTILSLGLLVTGLVLIFKNSGIGNHEG